MASARSKTVVRMTFPDRSHDHARCRGHALEQANEVCAARGARLTPLRRRVLEIVWASHRPIGAYEILDRLKRERAGAAPPTVYRALEFLMAHGLVHRIASLNGFVGCPHPADSHVAQFLICRNCGNAAELHDRRIDEAIAESAARAGFAVGRRTLEVEGLCPHCRANPAYVQSGAD